MYCQNCKDIKNHSEHKCLICNVKCGDHLCREHAAQGYWIDPAGGVNSPDDHSHSQYE